MPTRAAALAVVGLAAASTACAATPRPTRILGPQTTWTLPAGEPIAPLPVPGEGAQQAPELSGALRPGEGAPEPGPVEADAHASRSSSSVRCPAEMALVDDHVCVDRWEGTIVERVRDEERPWSPYAAVDGREPSMRAVSRPGVIPQGYISGKQAKAACIASGKRLCAADEWEAACRGPAHTTFPYGPTRRAKVCNDDVRSVHPVAEVALWVGLPADQWWRAGMNLALINQLPDGLLATGERAECTNDYGVFDMVGNLHEWIDDADGTFRGGYYMDTTLNGDGCDYHTTAHSFDYHDYSTGFRCCMDADRVE